MKASLKASRTLSTREERCLLEGRREGFSAGFEAANEQAKAGFVREGKLADALASLLDDSQHLQHKDCEDGGFCPVREGRRVFEEWTAHWEGVAAFAKVLS